MTAMEKNQAATTNPMDGLNLVALRKYACPESGKKKNDWYLDCVECDRNVTCGAGRRVMKLLEEQTKPAEKKKLSLDDRFREALKHDDPYQWLIDNKYYVDRHVACNNYLKWQKKHPECPVFGNGHSMAVKKGEKGAAAVIDNTRKNIEKLFTGIPQEQKLFHYLGNGVKPECTFRAAYIKLQNWHRKYPDLSEKYGLHDICLMAGRISYRAKNKTVREVLEMLKKDNAKDDEVSLEEFLEEHVPEVTAEKEPPKPVLKAETKAPEKPGMIRTFDNSQQSRIGTFNSSQQSRQQVLLEEFSRKKREIHDELMRANNMIHTLQARITELSSLEEALDKAAMIFGMAPKKKEEATA